MNSGPLAAAAVLQHLQKQQARVSAFAHIVPSDPPGTIVGRGAACFDNAGTVAWQRRRLPLFSVATVGAGAGRR